MYISAARATPAFQKPTHKIRATSKVSEPENFDFIRYARVLAACLQVNNEQRMLEPIKPIGRHAVEAIANRGSVISTTADRFLQWTNIGRQSWGGHWRFARNWRRDRQAAGTRWGKRGDYLQHRARPPPLRSSRRLKAPAEGRSRFRRMPRMPRPSRPRS